MDQAIEQARAQIRHVTLQFARLIVADRLAASSGTLEDAVAQSRLLAEAASDMAVAYRNLRRCQQAQVKQS